jgi:hypothetical protein
VSHRYDRSKKDPYVEAARHVEERVFSARDEDYRAAEDQSYEVLSNAIVAALGDIAAAAYRYGINSPHHMKGLSRAVAETCDVVFGAYRGEVDPEAALHAVEHDPRVDSLPPVARDKLRREVESTRQLEHLLLSARRIPDLIDYAGSLGLEIQDEVMDEGTLLIGQHPTPTVEDR